MGELSFVVRDSEAPWKPTEGFCERLTATYPALDVDAELWKAAVWCMANPRRRKTCSGMPRFLVAWLNRASAGTALAQTVRRHPDIPRGRDVWQQADAYARSRTGR